jgi:hypothetical protein
VERFLEIGRQLTNAANNSRLRLAGKTWLQDSGQLAVPEIYELVMLGTSLASL